MSMNSTLFSMPVYSGFNTLGAEPHRYDETRQWT